MAGALQCARVGCVEFVSYDRPLCELHWQEFNEFRLSECAQCHRFDDMLLDLETVTEDVSLCFDCARGVEVPVHDHGAVERPSQYLYILTLDGGDYYLGQTGDLERQVEEHYHGQFPSTAGRHPQLVWSERWIGPSVALQQRMDELTGLLSENPSAVLYKLQARLPLGGIQWG